ncbi:putative lactoylglutathione lyase [Pontibacter ummariensis]|uniref:Predicted lactoylglutathione lyase n=1 Tax=Pontibacter ummariensis TaxID=1610492 RepID=A0A239K1L4_9BACT|nr:VOC family protein [Pontibacter ummariensis]PRY06816.1 putative lactoylglutathione lyase [Pontibacter ummariensis]SNT11592.1 Predicted lactoylglutathione lyase [Pontibacter ummariensis]
MTEYNHGLGISHLEFWVKDLEESLSFYSQLFPIIGWYAHTRTSFSCGIHEIYFKEMPVERHDSLGVRHICFHANSREMVDRVGEWLQSIGAGIIRGPQPMPHYTEQYYTVDFRDPNDFVLEVAYMPDIPL